MSDRGIKKWAPYKALIEQEPALNKTVERRNIKEKPIMSDDVAEEINEILVNYHGQQVEIEYYRNNKVYQIISSIKKIDIYEQKLLLESRSSIYFSEIINLRNKD